MNGLQKLLSGKGTCLEGEKQFEKFDQKLDQLLIEASSNPSSEEAISGSIRKLKILMEQKVVEAGENKTPLLTLTEIAENMYMGNSNILTRGARHREEMLEKLENSQSALSILNMLKENAEHDYIKREKMDGIKTKLHDMVEGVDPRKALIAENILKVIDRNESNGRGTNLHVLQGDIPEFQVGVLSDPRTNQDYVFQNLSSFTKEAEAIKLYDLLKQEVRNISKEKKNAGRTTISFGNIDQPDKAVANSGRY